MQTNAKEENLIIITQYIIKQMAFKMLYSQFGCNLK